VPGGGPRARRGILFGRVRFRDTALSWGHGQDFLLPGSAQPAELPSVGALLAMVTAVACAIGLLWMGLPEAFSEAGQTDFEAPYYALKVEDAGGNPWDHAQAVKAKGGYVQHLMYPPHVLRFFRLFAFESEKKAKDVFLASKLVCSPPCAFCGRLGSFARGHVVGSCLRRPGLQTAPFAGTSSSATSPSSSRRSSGSVSSR